jgi:hypothetical protein
VSVSGNRTSAVVESATVSRPEVLITDSRGVLYGLWDPSHGRYAFVHLNDRYAGVDPATGLPAWRTTGLGDTCVNAAVVFPSGVVLLAVADGGVARTVDGGVTWTRPAERWPGALAVSSQGEALIWDGEGGQQTQSSNSTATTVSSRDASVSVGCAYVAHWDRGSPAGSGTVLASCDEGVSWSVLGGWNGTATSVTAANGTNGSRGLNINGSMVGQLVFDFATDSGLKSRALWLSSTAGALFYGAPDPATGPSEFGWVEVPMPAVSSAGGPRASTRINALHTTTLAPSMLFVARGDGLWAGVVQKQVGDDVRRGLAASTVTVSWSRLGGVAMYEPTAVLALPSPVQSTAEANGKRDINGHAARLVNESIVLVVGASANPWGSAPSLFRGVVPLGAADSGASQRLHRASRTEQGVDNTHALVINASFDLMYDAHADAPNGTSADESSALTRMSVSALVSAAAPAVDDHRSGNGKQQRRVLAGLHAGDYFDLYLPPYLLESVDSGVSWRPSDTAAGVTNANVAGLTALDNGTVCVSTNGDGLQCF